MTIEGDFRDILVNEYEKRVVKNPIYSMRAFARDLKLSPAHLSQVLRGKEGLSRSSAQRAAQFFYQDPNEVEHFCNLVESQHGRSWAGREAAMKSLSELWAKNKKEITAADFSTVMDWYHMAILHLTDLKSFKSDPDWIADFLGIEIDEAITAIEHLAQLGILESSETGLKRIQGAFIHSQDVPRPVIREYHRQMIEKALDAIEEQSIDQRFLTSITFGASKENLEEMKECIKRFVAEIERISYKSESAANKEELYSLNLQLFSLQKQCENSHA